MYHHLNFLNDFYCHELKFERALLNIRNIIMRNVDHHMNVGTYGVIFQHFNEKNI